MAYATRLDLEALFGESVIADLLLRHADPDAAVLVALDHASEEIDGWVATRYQTPFAIVPATVKRMCCVISRYNLYGRDVPTNEPVYIAYADELKALKAIAQGLNSLPAPTIGAGETPAAEGKVQVRARRQVFGPDVLRHMP